MWVIHLLVWIFRSLEAAEKRRLSALTAGQPITLPGAAPPRPVQPQQAVRASVPSTQSGLSPRLQQDQAQHRPHRATPAHRPQPTPQQQHRPQMQSPSPPAHGQRHEARFTHPALPPMVDDAPAGPLDWFLRLLEGGRR